jgi:hypothetical protein
VFKKCKIISTCNMYRHLLHPPLSGLAFSLRTCTTQGWQRPGGRNPLQYPQISLSGPSNFLKLWGLCHHWTDKRLKTKRKMRAGMGPGSEYERSAGRHQWGARYIQKGRNSPDKNNFDFLFCFSVFSTSVVNLVSSLEGSVQQ